MKQTMIAALASGAVLFASTANAQQPDFSKVQIKTTDLGNRTYMLEGQGGNIVAACGDDAVIQVDTEFAPLHDKIKAAIDQACGGKPIKYIVNTHFHGDHTGGNGEFATKDKATVVARVFTVVYFLFFLLMPWYTARDKTKPVPDRLT